MIVEMSSSSTDLPWNGYRCINILLPQEVICLFNYSDNCYVFQQPPFIKQLRVARLLIPSNKNSPLPVSRPPIHDFLPSQSPQYYNILLKIPHQFRITPRTLSITFIIIVKIINNKQKEKYHHLSLQQQFTPTPCVIQTSLKLLWYWSKNET